MSIPIGLLLLCIYMLLAAGGLILVQRSVPIAMRRQHNDVAGFIYAVLGVVYAVLLGLVVVAVWEQWNAAADRADQEASELAEVFWVADRMPESKGHNIQELVHSYARVVVEEEWPLMRQGKSSQKAWALLDEIRSEVQDFQPSTPAQTVLYEQGLERVHELADARRERLLLADHGLPAILWVVLIIGGGRGHRIHLPLWPRQHRDSRSHGGRIGPDHRPRPLHGRRTRFSVQGRHKARPRSHGTDPRQVRNEHAERSVKAGFKRALPKPALVS